MSFIDRHAITLMVLLSVLMATLLSITINAHAQAGFVSNETSRWAWELWAIVQPFVVMLVGTIGPLILAWLAAKIGALLNVQDENKRKELEQKISAALHQSATNALSYAVSKLGMPAIGTIDASNPVVQEAIKYVREKNPDAIDAFNLDNKALSEIIMSKAPHVGQMVDFARQAAGQRAPTVYG